MDEPEKLAWYSKHPCANCRAGYGECASGLKHGLQCCQDCDHPTRWTETPYTPEDYREMGVTELPAWVIESGIPSLITRYRIMLGLEGI